MIYGNLLFSHYNCARPLDNLSLVKKMQLISNFLLHDAFFKRCDSGATYSPKNTVVAERALISAIVELQPEQRHLVVGGC